MEKTVDPAHEIGENVMNRTKSVAIDNPQTSKKNKIPQNRKSGD